MTLRGHMRRITCVAQAQGLLAFTSLLMHSCQLKYDVRIYIFFLNLNCKIGNVHKHTWSSRAEVDFVRGGGGGGGGKFGPYSKHCDKNNVKPYFLQFLAPSGAPIAIPTYY